MAEVEDYADFGSHFLDSMLEVEMTVEDGEVNVPQPEDPLGNENAAFELPSTPTFDLQSESFGSYNTIYRNPMAAGSAIQPSRPMLTIHSRDIMSSNVLSNPQMMQGGKLVAQKIITPGKVVTAPKLIAGTNNLVSPTFQQVLSKPNAKPAIAIKTPTSSAPKIINASGIVTTTPTGTATPVSITKTEFLNFIFKPEFVKNVFEKPEAPRDIAAVLVDEMNYYRSAFRDVQNVRFCRLHCTICDRHLGCGSDVEDKVTVHNMLKVLVCKACYEFYGDGNFPCDAVDNCEIYCRWCGQGGALVCCSFCPRVFCKKCVRRNYGHNFLRAIEKANDWACFCCAQKPLWPHRAICRALMEYIVMRKKSQNLPKKDISSCCDLTPKKKKILPKSSPTPSPSPLSQPNQQQNSVTVIGGGSDPAKKLIVPVAKVVNNNNYSMIAKNKDLNKNQISPIRIVNTIQNPNFKNNILRNYNTLGGSKNFSPQNIQSPVIHGQTLITPPASRQPVKNTPPQGPRITPQKLGPKPTPIAPRPGGKPPPQSTPKQKPPLVMVSLSNQSNAVDLSKIPTAKIPQNVQGLILRMNFPDNKVQLVRLVTEGNGCNGGKNFPMPEFKKKSDSEFLETQLESSFKLTKILFDRLMVIKDKVSSKTKITEESVYNSSVKKLHMIYEKTSELLKDLDNELLKGFEDWKNEKSGGGVDVIDLSDEEKSTKNNRLSNFDEKTKELLQNADSDIEILDDDEPDKSNDLANGEGEDSVDPPRSRSRASSNNDSNSTPDELKEKYGLKDLSVKLNKLPSKRKSEKRSKKTDEDDDIYESKTDVDESDGESDDQNPKKRTKVDDGKTDENETVENNGDYDMSTETEDNVADDSGDIENHSDNVRENNDGSVVDEEREQDGSVVEDKDNDDSAVGGSFEEDNEGIKDNEDSADEHKDNDDSEVNNSDKINESANEHNYSAMEVSESNENSQDVSNNENDDLDNEKNDDATEE